MCHLYADCNEDNELLAGVSFVAETFGWGPVHIVTSFLNFLTDWLFGILKIVTIVPNIRLIMTGQVRRF